MQCRGKIKHSSFRHFKTSPEIIRLVVMLYARFPLLLRNIKDLLNERGIEICHEAARFWRNKFGPLFAFELRRERINRMRAYSNLDDGAAREGERSLSKRYHFKLNRTVAQAHGVRAKTDKVDARMLAVMGLTFSLEPQASASNNQRDIKELHVARQALIKDRTRALNRQKTLTLPILKRQAKARITQLETQLSLVDDAINELLMSTPETARAFDIICSIPGLSKVSAVALLIEMPELGTLKEKQVASLAGGSL